MNGHVRRVAIVGAGPRGLCVLERICADAAGSGPGTVEVHLVDPHRPGAGQVWRTDQSLHLLMNTVASQVTVFTDVSVTMAGPVRPGPSLYEWARFLTLMAPPDSYPDHVMAEARDLGPDDYPTRAFYGQYLEWAFRHVVQRARPEVRVVPHRARAVGLGEDSAGGQRVRLDTGETVEDLDAVVLALGHLPVGLDAEQADRVAFASAHGLVYLAPANPADVDLSVIGAGEPVAVVGLGLTFFDYLTLLTTGRGGTFERVEGRLRYLPSGREPRVLAGSRRGVPYQARGENQKGVWGRHRPLVLTEDAIDRLRKRAADEGGLDFRRDLWPLIAKEVETEYYSALLRSGGCGCSVEDFRRRHLELPWGGPQEAELLEELGIGADRRWSWERIDRPYLDRAFSGPEDFDAWLLGYLRADLAHARLGNVAGPLKAALDVLRDLRNEVRLLVDHGGLTGRSYRSDLERWYSPLNAFLSIGPPARRVEEAAALVEAGVLRLVGPDTRVLADAGAGRFVLDSPAVPGSRVEAVALVEARIPEPDLPGTRDRLLRSLAEAGDCDVYRIPGGDAEPYRTRGLAVGRRPYHLLDASGTPHPRRFAFGIPTEAVHWATAAGARPGVDSVTLADADAVARAALRVGTPQTAEGGEPVGAAGAR